MFVAVEFQNMRSRCPSEMEKLLEKLSIPIPDWSGNEYRIYEQLDDDITKKICAVLKSSSIIEGYTNLLKLGDIAYDYSETDNELLDKIISNGDKILSAVRNANEEYDLWKAEWGNVSPAPERVETLNVTAFDMKPFDKENIISVFEDRKDDMMRKRLSGAAGAVAECIADVKNLKRLFELENEIPFEDLPELLKEISSSLPYNRERTICLKIRKAVKYESKKIPPEPPFTVREIEDALKILIQVNEIIKKI